MASYRLGRYRIIEDQYGQLRWESYFGFARTKTGRCFIAGDILFLEPSTEIDEPGYLIGEYEQLVDRLPQWTKTKYYCSFYTIKACHAGTTLPLKTIGSQTPAQKEAVTNGVKAQVTSTLESGVNLSRHRKAVCYRLAHYKIIENERGGLWWKTYAGLGRLKSGTCFVEGDILFIGHPRNEEAGARRKFVEHLRQLPKWEKTNYYCFRYTLETCNPGTARSSDAISKRSGEWTKRATNRLISEMCNAVIRLRHIGDTDAGFKKYIDRIRRSIASMGGHLH
jgi:hypothetical protein